MKSLLYLTLFLFVLFCFGCGPDGGPSLPGEPFATDTVEEEESDELAALLANFEREVWQKPKMVISRMGDLSDKTVADIGAGYGYFTFRLAQEAEKVIAIDVDSIALEVITEEKKKLDRDIQKRIETRLCPPNDPNLTPNEADLAIFVNTYIYIADRVDYLKRLKEGVAPGGQVLIIDFKKKNLPFGPPAELKLALSQVEQELSRAGWEEVRSDDTSLDYQYIVTARRGSE